MKLKAWLQDDDLAFVTMFEVDNQDFAPDVIKWRDDYFVRHTYRDEGGTMHVAYVQGSFEDFSSQEAKQ
jgi:hypothetical protein